MELYIGGLDIGQTTDPAALAGLRKDGDGDKAVYTLGLLHRFPLRTLYPELVRQTGEMMTRGPLKGAPLAMDQTGVGRAVVDMAREKLTGTWLVPITITSGQKATKQEDWSWHVPKKDLIGVVLRLLHSDRLIFAGDLRLGKLLHKELQNFQMKITVAGNETFGAWREGEHDDLILALAVACWVGESFLCGPWDATPDPRARDLVAKAPPGVFFTDDPDVRGGRGGHYAPDEDDEGYGGGGPLIPDSW